MKRNLYIYVHAQVQTLDKEVSSVQSKLSGALSTIKQIENKAKQSAHTHAQTQQDAVKLGAVNTQLQSKIEQLENSLSLERGRGEGKHLAAVQAREQGMLLENKLSKTESERSNLSTRAKQLELEVMEMHTRIAMTENAASLAHERQVAAAESTKKRAHELEVVLQQQTHEKSASEQRVRVAHEEVERAHAHAQQAIHERVAQTEVRVYIHMCACVHMDIKNERGAD